MDPIIDAPIDASQEAGGPPRDIIDNPVHLPTPTARQIEEYLRATNPLSFGEGELRITDIDPEPFSGHFNFLVEGEAGKAVFRVKGPEWGSPIDGIENEYNILKYVERYDVAPQPLFFDREGMQGAPVMLTEFLEGELFTKLSEEDQKKLLPTIGTFIAEINTIPVDPSVLPFDYSLTSLAPHRDKWWRRVQAAESDERLKEWCAKASDLLPRAELVLAGFDKVLSPVIERGDSCFVFVSSHAGQLIVTRQGLRFVNWEAVRVGDPSFTLAVFLSSIAGMPYATEARKAVVDQYLRERPVEDFDIVLNQRLVERAVSDYTWLLWKSAKSSKAAPVDEAVLGVWYDRAAKAIINGGVL